MEWKDAPRVISAAVFAPPSAFVRRATNEEADRQSPQAKIALLGSTTLLPFGTTTRVRCPNEYQMPPQDGPGNFSDSAGKCASVAARARPRRHYLHFGDLHAARALAEEEAALESSRMRRRGRPSDVSGKNTSPQLRLAPANQ